MSFPKYGEYKDSGIGFIGEIPEHWSIVSWRRLILSLKDFGSNGSFAGLRENVTYLDNPAFARLVRLTDLREDLENDGGVYVSQENYEYLSQSSLFGGEFLIANVGAYAGLVCEMPKPDMPATLGPNMMMVKHWRDDLVSVKYLITAAQSQLVKEQLHVLATKSSAQPKLNKDDVRAVVSPLPPLDEQKAISSFLDAETSKIDALVAEQRRLIELLKEKRQAVISHAVTKGLNPNAPMKDSGIEWLGDVPEHWEVLPLKRLGNICYGIGEPPKYQDEGTPLVRATNVRSGTITPVGLVFVNPEDIPEQRIVWLESGDIIVVRSGAGTGDSAIIPDDYGPAIAGFDMVLRIQKATPWYIQFVLLSSYVKEGQIDLEKMRAAQPHLNAEELGNCEIVLPPDEEQKSIVEYLSNQTKQFDLLMIEAEQAIQLLQERRTALISAAVTGKIDVREYATQETA